LRRWSENTEAAAFHLSQEVRNLADKTEALTLQIWLTKVTPVTEVTVLPQDDSLLDMKKVCNMYAVVRKSLFHLQKAKQNNTRKSSDKLIFMVSIFLLFAAGGADRVLSSCGVLEGSHSRHNGGACRRGGLTSCGPAPPVSASGFRHCQLPTVFPEDSAAIPA
jgi:hypothetical protein